jgi:hypothetical protein
MSPLPGVVKVMRSGAIPTLFVNIVMNNAKGDVVEARAAIVKSYGIPRPPVSASLGHDSRILKFEGSADQSCRVSPSNRNEPGQQSESEDRCCSISWLRVSFGVDSP